MYPTSDDSWSGQPKHFAVLYAVFGQIISTLLLPKLTFSRHLDLMLLCTVDHDNFSYYPSFLLNVPQAISKACPITVHATCPCNIAALLRCYAPYLALCYRRFGTTYRSHLQGSISPRGFIQRNRYLYIYIYIYIDIYIYRYILLFVLFLLLIILF